MLTWYSTGLVFGSEEFRQELLAAAVEQVGAYHHDSPLSYCHVRMVMVL